MFAVCLSMGTLGRLEPIHLRRFGVRGHQSRRRSGLKLAVGGYRSCRGSVLRCGIVRVVSELVWTAPLMRGPSFERVPVTKVFGYTESLAAAPANALVRRLVCTVRFTGRVRGARCLTARGRRLAARGGTCGGIDGCCLVAGAARGRRLAARGGGFSAVVPRGRLLGSCGGLTGRRRPAPRLLGLLSRGGSSFAPPALLVPLGAGAVTSCMSLPRGRGNRGCVCGTGVWAPLVRGNPARVCALPLFQEIADGFR